MQRFKHASGNRELFTDEDLTQFHQRVAIGRTGIYKDKQYIQRIKEFSSMMLSRHRRICRFLIAPKSIKNSHNAEDDARIPTTEACVETHTMVFAPCNLVAQIVLHVARLSHAAQAHCLSAGILTLRQDVRQRWITRSTPTSLKNPSWSYSVHCRELSHHERLRRRRWLCLLFFLHLVAPCSPLFLLMFFDNFYCQMILGVLLCQHRVVLPLLDFQPTRMYLFTWLKWLMVLCIVSESFSREALRERVALHQQRRAWAQRLHQVLVHNSVACRRCFCPFFLVPLRFQILDGIAWQFQLPMGLRAVRRWPLNVVLR